MTLAAQGPKPENGNRLPFLKLAVGEKATLQIADVRDADGLEFADIILDVRKGKELLSLPVRFSHPNYARLVEKFSTTFKKWIRGKVTVIGAVSDKYKKEYVQVL